MRFARHLSDTNAILALYRACEGQICAHLSHLLHAENFKTLRTARKRTCASKRISLCIAKHQRQKSAIITRFSWRVSFCEFFVAKGQIYCAASTRIMHLRRYAILVHLELRCFNGKLYQIKLKIYIPQYIEKSIACRFFLCL